MILHVQTFWKAIIAWFSTTNNIIPLHCDAAALELISFDPNSTTLSQLHHSGCLRLFLNSQMLIRDKLATFPELYIYLYSFRFTDYSVYMFTSIPNSAEVVLFFSTEKRQHMPRYKAMTNRFKSILPKWFLCAKPSWKKKCSFQILLLLRGSAVSVFTVKIPKWKEEGILTKGPFKACSCT